MTRPQIESQNTIPPTGHEIDFGPWLITRGTEAKNVKLEVEGEVDVECKRFLGQMGLIVVVALQLFLDNKLSSGCCYFSFFCPLQ